MVITYNKGKANEFNALQHINAEIYPREYIILFGPSGCGKSTLLYTMLGGIVPESGHMFVKGEDIYKYTPLEMNRYQQATIGIVYQQFNLISSISVWTMSRSQWCSSINRQPNATNAARSSCAASAFPNASKTNCRPTCRVVNSSASPSRAPWSTIRRSCLPTNRSATSTVFPPSTSWILSKRSKKDRKTVILVTHDAKYLPYAHRVFYMRDGVLQSHRGQR